MRDCDRDHSCATHRHSRWAQFVFVGNLSFSPNTWSRFALILCVCVRSDPIANQLKAATSRDEFDKAAAANKVDFAAFIEADIKRTCRAVLWQCLEAKERMRLVLSMWSPRI
jgi:hypothetical protein